jgi:hypothetical protein
MVTQLSYYRRPQALALTPLKPSVTGVCRSVSQDRESTMEPDLVRKGRNGVTHTSIRTGGRKLEHERGATG